MRAVTLHASVSQDVHKAPLMRRHSARTPCLQEAVVISMLLKHAALALSVFQALLALASPTKPFAVQDSIPCSASDHTHGDAESAAQPLAARSPEVRLDDAVFVGIARGDTHQFLGIPFAYPP
jgi:hypothetical protein